jgi:hypothetical protein
MWGNRLGWGISLLIVLLVGGWVYLIERGSARTPATDFSKNPANFEPLRLPEPPESVFNPTSPADAGPLYRRAIDAYLADRATYSNFAASGKLDSPKRGDLAAAIDPLIEASASLQMDLFAARPGELVNYASQKPSLEALETLGRVTIDRLALLNHRAGNTDDAKKCYLAGFALGLNLARERVTWQELDLGLQLIGKTAPMLAKLSEETGKPIDAAAYRELDDRRREFAASLEPTLRIVRTIDPTRVATHSGDVFELAKRSKERMWRVEAMLALGRMRHFAGAGGTAANQRAANAFLADVAENEADPVVRAAAQSARELTVEQHRMQ